MKKLLAALLTATALFAGPAQAVETLEWHKVHASDIMALRLHSQICNEKVRTSEFETARVHLLADALDWAPWEALPADYRAQLLADADIDLTTAVEIVGPGAYCRRVTALIVPEEKKVRQLYKELEDGLVELKRNRERAMHE
jgi:hypothetical protein